MHFCASRTMGLRVSAEMGMRSKAMRRQFAHHLQLLMIASVQPGQLGIAGKEVNPAFQRVRGRMPSSATLSIMGRAGYGVKILVQNSAPGCFRHTSIINSMVSRRSLSSSPGKPKMMLNDGRIPAARLRAAVSMIVESPENPCSSAFHTLRDPDSAPCDTWGNPRPRRSFSSSSD